jgi:hypothetical protein
MTQSTGDDLIAGLAPHLSERARWVGDNHEAGEGEFILYWMHHAVRDHENPALDTALQLGRTLQRPVLVYQGLAGNHPHNNDRHHRFILEGAREAHAALDARGITAVFALSGSDGTDSPLRRLLDRAAVAVFEDYPAPPFPRWSGRLAKRCTTPVIAVDASCIVPMQAQRRRHARAFEFRRATSEEFAQRIPIAWPEAESPIGRYLGDLGFAPVALSESDLDALCAAAPIDHTVPPVPGTPGGSSHGYARWSRFKDQGLRRYDRERNDAAMAWPRGVSRMSPYLHHGQVSPWRIAREAWQLGGAGADKFLDELLIWRELAFNFCARTGDPERLAALPEWAQETLESHRHDQRPELVDPETLAASGSPDPLWNLAQDSLRLHGELHNNLRMTWAKALPFWRPDPEAALKALIDLNHRYALDGSDPNSYGGLLWALGLFDRPFDEQPVIGRLRSRSSAAHAKRLDTAAYRRRVTQPASGPPRRIAVIGAGVSGLAAARALHDQGHRVLVFEKSRGPGGRSATRRLDGVSFDHGAQYFKVRDPRFRRVVDAWVESGQVSPWRGKVGRVADGTVLEEPDRGLGFVGVPGMNAVGKALAAGLSVRHGTRVETLERDGPDWVLRSDTGETLGTFDALVVAVPAPQAAPLLAPVAPELADRAAGIVYAPTWAAMLEFDAPLGLSADGLLFDDAVLSWAARNGAKPQRTGETWVLHATPDWTRSHLDATPDAAIDSLQTRFRDALGLRDLPLRQAGAQRWLYGLVENPLPDEALWLATHRLAVCGDWCAGPRIESAFLSGQAAAGYLLRGLAAEWRESTPGQ